MRLGSLIASTCSWFHSNITLSNSSTTHSLLLSNLANHSDTKQYHFLSIRYTLHTIYLLHITRNMLHIKRNQLYNEYPRLNVSQYCDTAIQCIVSLAMHHVQFSHLCILHCIPCILHCILHCIPCLCILHLLCIPWLLRVRANITFTVWWRHT